MRGRLKVCNRAACGVGHHHVSPCVHLACTGLGVSWPACFIGTSVLYIEADLPEGYPSEATPDFSLSNINNSHLSAQTKEAILKGLLDQVSKDCLTFYCIQMLTVLLFPGKRSSLAACQACQMSDHVHMQPDDAC